MRARPALPADVIPVIVGLRLPQDQRGHADAKDVASERGGDTRGLGAVLKRHLQIRGEVGSRSAREWNLRAEKIQNVRRVQSCEEDADRSLNDTARRRASRRERDVV